MMVNGSQLRAAVLLNAMQRVQRAAYLQAIIAPCNQPSFIGPRQYFRPKRISDASREITLGKQRSTSNRDERVASLLSPAACVSQQPERAQSTGTGVADSQPANHQ